MDHAASIRKQIEAVPWPQLTHAYDFAVDAPHHLAAFFEASEPHIGSDLAEAIDWMWISVLHQGSVYSASVPSVSILVDLLDLKPDHPAGVEILGFVDTVAAIVPYSGSPRSESSATPLRENADPLFETWVGAGVASIEQDRDRFFRAARVRKELLVALLGRAIPVIGRLLNSAEIAMRDAAAGALSRIASNVAELFDDAASVGLSTVLGDERFGPGAWVSTAMSLREPPINLLDHPDRRLRLAAAMNPGLSENRVAINQLIDAMNDVPFLEANFPEGAPTLMGHFRFSVLQAALERVPAVRADRQMVDAICNQLATRTTKACADFEWGPAVQWAFAERRVMLPMDDADMEALPTVLTYPQRSVLETMIGIDELWDPRFGNGSLAFRRVQLPYDRQALGRLLGAKRRSYRRFRR